MPPLSHMHRLLSFRHERFSLSRRTLLATLGVLPVAVALFPMPVWNSPTIGITELRERLVRLEAASGGRLGIAAIDTADGRSVDFRGNERFPMCSTFKILAAAAVLREDMKEPDLLQRRVFFRPEDVVPYSPVTSRRLAEGMTLAELCGAALQYSDNTAANLLLDFLGGPEAVTAFAREVGDRAFRLDRREPELNSAIPGDDRDTTTPAAMAETLHGLACGTLLSLPQRGMLLGWLRGNTTGGTRIRAGIPADWDAGDKTGSGGHGTTNDVAVLWPPRKVPMLLAVYLTQAADDARERDAVLAETARLICAGHASDAW